MCITLWSPIGLPTMFVDLLLSKQAQRVCVAGLKPIFALDISHACNKYIYTYIYIYEASFTRVKEYCLVLRVINSQPKGLI